MDVVLHNGAVEEISEKLDKSLSMDTDSQMEKYHRLIQEAKDVARQGDMCKALTLFKLAYEIHQSQKLQSRIQKIEELISQNESEEDDEEFVDVNGSGLMLFKDLHDKLYGYQRDGVAFLYSLHRDRLKGGILADDMGLGKTIQVISFLSGMYDSELVKHTLLVMPTSLITNWTKEFAKWTPGMRVKEFHGTSKGERTRNLEKVQRRGGVIITTYTMLMNNWQQLASYNGREFTWDYMILDEAHKIKTHTTKTAKSASAILSKNRVLLTGTPVQNNLREMWALFEFACQGTLLGTAKTFKAEYENPITRAREKDATPGEKALGSRMSENLMAIIKPHFLRRTKAEVQKQKADGSESPNEERRPDASDVPPTPKEKGAVTPSLTRKNDLIIWTYLSPVQEDIYRQFLSLDHIKELLMTTKSPLAELNILKKLCDHPRLLSAAAIAKLGLEDSAATEEADGAHGIANIPDHTLISESGKMVFLFALLERLRDEGHRTLVFAHYRKVLDIIERILGNRGFKVMRLDGTITQIAERERRITLFQQDQRYHVFLLTTQVGGVGITLTAANRVVIYDPSWNPATDAQAVDRAYRIGQTENVVIYRLITCGTVEEKIYRRQVFKDSLIRQNTGDKKNPFRYFSKQELKELFTLEDARSSSTQLQLQALHSSHRRTDPELDLHIAHLHSMDMFGISDHDLMFSLDVHHDEAPEDEGEHRYIEGRVQKARELMKAESELQMQLAENMASSTEPAWLRQRDDGGAGDAQKPRKSRPSPGPQQSWSGRNGSQVVVESDQEDVSGGVIDLTVAEVSPDESDHQNPGSPQNLSIKHETTPLEAGDVVQDSVVVSDDVSVQEIMDESASAEDSIQKAAPSGPGSRMDLDLLQESTSSFKAPDPSSRVSTGLESFEGNFNLQLDDSDMPSVHGTLEEEEEQQQEEEEVVELDQEEELEQEEEEERRLLSQLQMEGNFDVNQSLSESRRRSEGFGRSLDSVMDQSENDSIIATSKKRRAAVISDSEDDGGEDDEGQEEFQVLGASTPKSAPSGSTPRWSRKSVGGNTSVASRRSLLHSIIDDMENQEEEEEQEEEMEEAEEAEEDEEDIIGLTHDELQLEETTGETLNTEGEEEVEEEQEEQEEVEEEQEEEMEEVEEEQEAVEEEQEEEVEEEQEEVEEEQEEVEESLLEDSTTDPELASSERMEPCTVDTGLKTSRDLIRSEEPSYDSLVCRAKELYSHGNLDQALNCFLSAIDIRPGDPEIQLLTIQLYRQLSQRPAAT